MAETYTLKLLVDDSAVRRLESRINRIMGMNMPGEQKGQQTVYGMFQKLPQFLSNMDGLKQLFNSGSVKKFLKLATIVGFIPILFSILNAIKDAVVRSSPLLGAGLRLFETAVMFFFRPFGDFLGALMIPIARDAVKFFAGWNKFAGPVMRALGEIIGENWKAFFMLIMSMVELAVDFFSKFKGEDGGFGLPKFEWPDLGGFSLPEMPAFDGIAEWFSGISEKFREFAATLPEKISGWFSGISEKFREFAATLPEKISGWFAWIRVMFRNFAESDLLGIIAGWLGFIREKFSEIRLNSILVAIIRWFRAIGTVIGGLEVKDIMSFVRAWFDVIRGLIKQVEIGSIVRAFIGAILDIIKGKIDRSLSGFGIDVSGGSWGGNGYGYGSNNMGQDYSDRMASHWDAQLEKKYRGLRRN